MTGKQSRIVRLFHFSLAKNDHLAYEEQSPVRQDFEITLKLAKLFGGNRLLQATRQWSETMDEKQEQTKKWIEYCIKLALGLAVLFPVYALLYLTFPASILAFYLVSAALFAVFAPWDALKKKFLS